MVLLFQSFFAVASLIAVASANQASHQTVKQGNAPAVHTAILRPHASAHAKVVSQPSAQPNEVHQAYNEEKYTASTHAAAAPVHGRAYHGAPIHHAPVHGVHAVHAPIHGVHAVHAPVHAVHAAPAYAPKPAYHPAPAYKPAAHGAHAETYDGPAVYQYGYAVADDYSGANFAQNEHRDGYSTAGEYRVALPDGRTQIVTYNTADAYSGNVADVRYEGEAKYEPYHPAPKATYHPAPAYHA